MKTHSLNNLLILSLFWGFPLSFSVASAESVDNQKHHQSHDNINGIQLAISGPVDMRPRNNSRRYINKIDYQQKKYNLNKKRIMDTKTTTFKARPVFNKIPVRNKGHVIHGRPAKK